MVLPAPVPGLEVTKADGAGAICGAATPDEATTSAEEMESICGSAASLGAGLLLCPFPGMRSVPARPSAAVEAPSVPSAVEVGVCRPLLAGRGGGPLSFSCWSLPLPFLPFEG